MQAISVMARILVADDEFLLAAWLEELLQEGHEVSVATNGDAALEEARRFMPDLLVTDFMMPRLTGSELATAIRSDARMRRMVIVLVSGAQGALARKRPDLFDAVLDKPYAFEALLSQIRRLLASKGEDELHA